jgi:hypothetical protein
MADKYDLADYATESDVQIDAGIVPAVQALRAGGIHTFESCEGGHGHAYPEPTVRFHGDQSEGYKALAVVMKAGLPVAELRRIWPILDGEPTGPWWEITFAAISRGG